MSIGEAKGDGESECLGMEREVLQGVRQMENLSLWNAAER